MYLLLAENNYISSREIKSLLDRSNISCEIVNCSSSDSVLHIAEKIAPDLVIIDFDLFIDDSANIVKELRRHSPGAYILAFVDPDHYSRLHKAIDDGIDNYMVKPLQREDVLLRIKMGLQHKSTDNSAFEGQEKVTELVLEVPTVPVTSPVVPNVPTMQEESVTESKKLFEDLADLFDKQVKAEEVEIKKSSEVVVEEVLNIIEEPLLKAKATDISGEIVMEEMANGQVEAAADLDLADLSPCPEFDFTWPGSGNNAAPLTNDNPEVESPKETAAVNEIDDDTLFGLSLNPEAKGFTAVEGPLKINDPQTLSLIDEAFSLVDINQDLESVTDPESSTLVAAEEPVAGSDLPYFDDLFNHEPQLDDKPTEDKRIETAASGVEHTEPDVFFEKETMVPNVRKPAIDDKELFGMTSGERTVDRSSFEELFGSFNEPAKKRNKTAVESGANKIQKGKVEYLPFARKSAAAISVPVDEPDDIIKDQPAVSEKPKKQKTKPQKSEKYMHKPAVEKEVQRGSNFLRVAGNILTALLLIIMVGLSFFLIQSRISGGSPAIAGYQMYVVLSGSMNPAFNTGSIVFVKPTEPTEIVEGDIITFSSSADATRLTTHRVVGLNLDNGLSFITRGDANNVNDPSPVPAENLVGRVTGSVPYIGYLFGYAQTRQGLVLLIFIPGLFLIVMELRRIFKYMVDAKVERLSRSVPTDSAPSGSAPVPQAALNPSVLPGSDQIKSLEDFGF